MNLENLTKGERIRLFVRWVGCQDVYIREGIILDPKDSKDDGFTVRPSLKIRVEKRGMVIRRKAIVEKVKRPYIKSYAYSNIENYESFI